MTMARVRTARADEIDSASPPINDDSGVDSDTHTMDRPPVLRLPITVWKGRNSALRQSGGKEPGRRVTPGRAVSPCNSGLSSPFTAITLFVMGILAACLGAWLLAGWAQ